MNIPALPEIGMIGCGAFGRLVLRHLAPYARFKAYDPALNAAPEGAVLASFEDCAACPIVLLATPVSALASVVKRISPHIRPGALVIDVGSVKAKPAGIMRAGLPAHAQILCTHPLFGPQSAKDGLTGLKIVLCPLRSPATPKVASFLRSLGLEVIISTPEEHDRELAVAQGLTHLIAQVLLKMEPLPSAMTTRSFDLIKQAVDMVRYDAPEVLHAIEQENPFAAEVRERFFALAEETKLGFEVN